MRCLPVLIASVAITGLTAEVRAQQPERPTLTVARFEGSLKSSHGTDAAADLADALAARVEDSGCCRVMPRSWLPRPMSEKPSLASVRGYF